MDSVFKMLDKDKNGSVSSKEIKFLFGNHIEDKVVTKMIREVDQDDDGEISF